MASRRYKDISATHNRHDGGKFWRHEIDSHVVDLRNTKNLRRIKEEQENGASRKKTVGGVDFASASSKPVRQTRFTPTPVKKAGNSIQKTGSMKELSTLDEEEYVRNYLESVKASEGNAPTSKLSEYVELSSYPANDTEKQTASNEKDNKEFEYNVQLIPPDNASGGVAAAYSQPAQQPVAEPPVQQPSEQPTQQPDEEQPTEHLPSSQDLGSKTLFQSYPGYQDKIKNFQTGSLQRSESGLDNFLEKFNPDKVLASAEGGSVNEDNKESMGDTAAGRSMDSLESASKKKEVKNTNNTENKELLSPFWKVFLVVSVVVGFILLLAFSAFGGTLGI